jgi:hypothetical protein
MVFRGTPSSPQMSNYTIFISWVLTTAYCFLYFGIFSVRRYGLFIIDDEQVRLSLSLFDSTLGFGLNSLRASLDI